MGTTAPKSQPVLRLLQDLTLQGLYLLQPDGGGSVRGHFPCASGRKPDLANGGTVGETGALELLIEEAAHKGFEPFFDNGIVKPIFECGFGFPEDFVGCLTPADEMIQEEIMEVIGTHNILGFL